MADSRKINARGAPGGRKFSETSLDNFATQFLKETDPESIAATRNVDESTQTDLFTASVDVSTQTGSIENQVSVTTDDTIAGGQCRQDLNQHTSPQRRSISSSGTFSVDSNGTVHIISNDLSGSVSADVAVIVQPGSSEFEIESQFETPSGLLECHLEVMYCFGVSSYRRNEYKPLSNKLHILQNAAFWIFSVFSCIQFLCQAKNETVRLAALKDLKYCVQFGYAMIQLIKRCFFIYLIVFLPVKISTMLRNFRKVIQYQSHPTTNRFQKRIRALVVGSLLLTCIAVLFGYTWLNDFEIEELLQSRSLQMSVTLYAWSTNKTIYEEKVEQLIDEYYGDNIETSHIFMGLTEGAFDFCAILQGDMIRNLLLVTATVLCVGWRYFEKRVEPMILIHPNNAEAAEVEACLKHYKALRQATASINGTLKPVVNSHMLENLFLYGYVIAVILTSKYCTMRIIYLSIEAIKATLTFYTALRSYWTNGNIGTWLRLMTTYKGPVDVEKILGMTVQAALDDVRDNPIGFGMDYFLINENFLMGFFAIVSSIISLLMNSAAEC